jgi:Uma2 family endonuclease
MHASKRNEDQTRAATFGQPSRHSNPDATGAADGDLSGAILWSRASEVPAVAMPRVAVPPLESGDHLTREEFHRRYLTSPEIRRAELIDGVVFVSSPDSYDHAEPHSRAVGWLYVYRARTPGVGLADNATLFLDPDNELQPDVCLFRVPPNGNIRFVTRREGRRRLRYLEGVPDLVLEIAASSASYDLHNKKQVYERNAIPVYIVWLIFEHRLVWFRLADGRYVEVEPDERGMIESSVFPGLRLAVDRLLAGDDAGVVAALDLPSG